MGSKMAENLQKKGHTLTVYDMNPETCVAFVKNGAKAVSTPAEVAANCDKLISMVPKPDHVRAVYLGPNGAIAGAKKGTILMDSSTIDAGTSRQVYAEAQKAGIDFLDTPVSGAVPAAAAASLTFMCGGKKDLVDAVRDVLLCMGKNVIHVGDNGAGCIAKICNNMMLGISMIGLCETLNLSKNLGLDPKLMTDILNISSGRCWSSEVYNPVPGIGADVLPPNNNYDGGFMVGLIAKDLMLAQSVAADSQSPIPMGTLASQLYRIMLNNGYDKKDFTFAYPFFQEKK